MHVLTADGLLLAGRRWPTPASPSGIGVVVVHGFTGTKDHPDTVAVAERLRDDGHDVLAYDSRGHGASPGECTLGNDEHLDVAAAVAAIRPHVDAVVAVGASMGSIAVLRCAAGDADLAGVVSVSGPARWRIPRTPTSLLAAGLTQTPIGRLVARRALGVRVASRWRRLAPPVELVAGIAGPVAVVHGRDDRFLLPTEATELHAAGGGPRHLDLVSGMGHGYHGRAVAAVADAVAWVLREHALATR